MMANFSATLTNLESDDGTMGQVKNHDSLIIVIIPTGLLLAIAFFLTLCSIIRKNCICFFKRRIAGCDNQYISGGHTIDFGCCSVVKLTNDEDHVIIVRDVTSLGQFDFENVCVICFDNFTTEARGTLQLSCSHVFHSDCIVTWLRRRQTCPLCKRDVDVTFIKEERKTTQLYYVCDPYRTSIGRGHAVAGHYGSLL